MIGGLRKKAVAAVKKNTALTFRLKLLNMHLAKVLTHIINDKAYITMQYRLRTGKKLNLVKPRLYNEKIQWLKLNYRNPVLPKLVDKYEVREYVRDKIGGEYLIPLLGVYSTPDEIDFNALPEAFVVKLTNGSGFNYICRNKSTENTDRLKSILRAWIKNINFYALDREWAYKGVKNRIICERLLGENEASGINDYKIFCFDGIPRAIQVDCGRFTNHIRNFYTTAWEYMPVSVEYPSDSSVNVQKPEKLAQILECAKRLSCGFPHVRVDFYYTEGNIYFGEMTFYHGGGYERFNPEAFGAEMGGWLTLPKPFTV